MKRAHVTKHTFLRHTVLRALTCALSAITIACGLVIATPLSASSSPAISETVVLSGLSIPFGMAIDRSGNLYVSDVGDNSIFKLTPSGVKSLFASPNGGSYAMAVDPAGDLFYANEFDNNIYEIATDGTQTTVATNIPQVFGLATNSLGDLFVSSYQNNTVTEIAPNGTQTPIGSFDGPWGLATDAENNLYVADYYDGTVWKVTPGGVRSAVVTGLAMGTPMDVTVDPSGNLYVGEAFNDTILEVAPNGTLSTFASLPYPARLVTTAQGDLYAVSASTNQVVEYLTTVNPPTNLTVSAGAGTESGSWRGDGTATSYTCTLMYGFTDPTTFTVTTTSDTCKFSGLATTNYGIQVVATNGETASSPVVGFAAVPTSTTTTTTTTVPRPSARTITCVKKKVVRRVRGVSPHCPAGYKQK